LSADLRAVHAVRILEFIGDDAAGALLRIGQARDDKEFGGS
jgi:hypothetical protein